MFRYNAVLFDLDGTLLNTVDDVAGALNQTLAEYRYPTHGTDKVASFLGNGELALIQRALPEHTGGAAIEQVLQSYLQRYSARPNEKTHPYPGVLPMLAALDEAGVRLAVVSNKNETIVQQLTRTYFGSLIHVAVGGGAGVARKPAPDMLHKAMRELNVPHERALYVGDAPLDFYAAENAGMDCILARWGYGDPETLAMLPPLYFANEPDELPMLILN